MQAARVDPAYTARDDHRSCRRPQHQRIEYARLRGVLLRVIQLAECTTVRQRETLGVEQHRRCHQRAGQGTTAGFVRAGHEAGPISRSKANRRLPLPARLRALWRHGARPSSLVAVPAPAGWRRRPAAIGGELGRLVRLRRVGSPRGTHVGADDRAGGGGRRPLPDRRPNR